MATRNIAKVSATADIRNWPNAAGIGFYQGRFWGNFNGSTAPLTGSNPFGAVLLVDADNGSDTDTRLPYATIQAAVTAASAGDTIYVKAKNMASGATDPSNYAETIIIPAGKSRLSIIGIGGGPVQGSLPQIKIGAGAVAMLDIRSPGCTIANLGFNGSSSTGGGIVLTDDGGTTNTAFGTVITGCHFKNCKAHATNSKLGGAVYWSAAGGAWQVLISGNRFFNCIGSISLVGTTGSRPKDVVIDSNWFGSDAATSAIDSYIYGAGGSGFNDVSVTNNMFASDKPSIGSGSVALYMDLTGVVTGIVANNFFGTADGASFGAAGTDALVPTTVILAENYDEGGTFTRT